MSTILKGWPNKILDFIQLKYGKQQWKKPPQSESKINQLDSLI